MDLPSADHGQQHGNCDDHSDSSTVPDLLGSPDDYSSSDDDDDEESTIPDLIGPPDGYDSSDDEDEWGDDDAFTWSAYVTTTTSHPSSPRYTTTQKLQPKEICIYRNQHRRSKALVDRGANGGIAGPEMRPIAWSSRLVDLSGIDDHTLRSVKIGSFGATVETHLGSRILVWNQMAHMPDGRTILSAAQMEAFKCTVNEKSPHVTGRTPVIISPEGYIMPLSINDGLPYLAMRPYTDKEWKDLPHIEMTSDVDWEPRILDADVPTDWYDRQDRFSSYLRDSPFTEDGDLKEETITGERPSDDPPEDNDVDAARVDRKMIRTYFHNIIRDECDDQFWYYEADGEMYEHVPTKTERRQINESRQRPRRSTANYEPTTKPPGKAKNKQRPQGKGGRAARRDKDQGAGNTHELSDEIERDWSEPDNVTGYNNPAKTMGDDHPATTGVPAYSKNTSRMVMPSETNYQLYSRHFPGHTLETIKKTFKATTQYGRKGAYPGHTFRFTHKAPNPALNVPRRNEAVATDTFYGPKNVPAVDDGSTAGQIFVGKESRWIGVDGCGHSDKAFVKVLYDHIRRYGAMDVLISDRAKAEISNRVKDVLRVLFIDDWQSEPHNKNQNFAERVWQELQAKANNLLNWSGAPDNCWLLALKYTAFIMNHVALDKLNGRTSAEWLFGHTPDITIILMFIFYEPVYFRTVDNKVGETSEAMGRFVGFAEGVGHAMTFLVLTNEGRVLRRSLVRSANKEGAFENFRAMREAENVRPGRVVIASPGTFGNKKEKNQTQDEIIPETVPDQDEETATHGPQQEIPSLMHPEDRSQPEAATAEKVFAATTVESSEPDPSATPEEWETDYSWKDRTVPPTKKEGIHRHSENRSPIIIDVDSLLKRSFITEPNEDGEQVRAVIEDVQPTGEKTADLTQPLFKFRARAGDETFERVMTYNRMLDWCDEDKDKNDFFNFDGILEHRKDPKDSKKWQLLVRWSSGEATWEPFHMIFGDDPVTVSMYARKHGMTNVWKCCRRYLKNTKTMARMVHQARLKNLRNRPKYKFGVQVPRNHEEAMKIDVLNGDTRWRDSEKLEVSQLNEYESFKDLGKGAEVPEGYTKIRCHFVYDVKHSGKFKSRFVAGGHMTDTPTDSIYSGVVSIPGIRMVTFLAELNGLELWATDIGNAYLESVTQEKVCFVAGPEFGDKKGHLFVIYKAQYGLKSSGKRWHEKLHDVLRALGFFPSKAEEDIWMRDAGDHYEYIAVYVDDLAISSKDPQKIIDYLMSPPNNFKLKGTGPIEYHLGNDYFRDEDGTLCFGPRRYIEKMAAEYQRMFGAAPKRSVLSPLEKNDHPELDDSPLLDDDGIRKYQSLIGTLQWTITLGRFDIGTAVMTMSSFRAAPREGHLLRLRRICGYLYRMKNGFIRVRTEEPDYSDLPHHEYDWTRSVYGDVRERKPEGAPPPKGKRVVTTTFKDANLYHDLTTGRAVTGVLHFVNQTPVDWYTKKQSTVETATCGSEFSAARSAIQQITALRLTLQYLGVPIHGPTHMFGDNESVVKSGTLPHSPLHKRWHGLAYHYTREAIASKMVTFHHIPGEINPADILSKHWGYNAVWQQLQAILFWEGDPADLLLEPRERTRREKGSDKVIPIASESHEAANDSNGPKA